MGVDMKHLSRIGIVIHTIVIPVPHVAIPIPRHDLERSIGDKPIHIQNPTQFGPPFVRIGFLSGLHQRLEVRSILYVTASAVIFERFRDLSQKSTVI
jgi:hypothetical protein